MVKLKVYQIYFDDEQVRNLDYTPIKNENCTVFFENSVIAKLISEKKHLNYDYFGVVSHKLQQKLSYEMKERWKNMPNIANHSTLKFTKEAFYNELSAHLPDIMSFQRHISHDPIGVADGFHPNFSKYFDYIMKKIGFNWVPTTFKDVFYCNYFVAKPLIYDKYVNEMLIPAMEIMMEMPELMQNSNYPKKLPEALQKEFGVNHYPYHSFLCERMFSYFVHLNNYKSIHF